MKIAIHNRENSFSDRWIDYCRQNDFDYVLVNCFNSDIISKLQNDKITHLMWHLDHSSQRELMVYPYVMNSLEEMSIRTFPNFSTRWHFDDKVAQKYLLESIGAELVPSFVFYNEKEALNHVEDISFPIVAKLKRGAGATNVKLLNNKQEAKEYIQKMFTTGINPNPGAMGNLEAKVRLAKNIKNPIKLLKKVIGHFKKSKHELMVNTNEKGYFYYQEFMPKNDYDTRVIVVDDKAIAIRRNNRKDDFRASGSGKIDYDSSLIDPAAIDIAFNISRKLETQSLAFDFVYDINKQLKIVEICFGFTYKAYEKCDGYWQYEKDFVTMPIDMPMEMIKGFLKQ